MIHLNIGSNLESKFGDRFENISTAVNLLIESKVQINKISNFTNRSRMGSSDF